MDKIWTIIVKRDSFRDEEGERWAFRAEIDSEYDCYGYGNSFAEAVSSLLDALSDLPAPDER